MILVGNQRGGSKDLALHLLKPENEHVEVHEIRGFASDDLMGALTEAYAVSRGTRCKQFLFSLSLNPPQRENVSTDSFERAIERIEDKLGLAHQPRAIVFHEKEGRRHCHAVWSRIDAQEMKAVPLPFTKRKLQDVSRDLYREHGWKMPRGLMNAQERDPRNFTLAEWQQAKRNGKDPRAIKSAFQDAWAVSDSKAAFVHALEEQGYRVARGDRRGLVAVDVRGEVYAIPKWAGVRTKQVRERIGDDSNLPSVAEIRARIADDMLSKMQEFGAALEAQRQGRLAQFEERRKALVEKQRVERETLNARLEAWQLQENRQRQDRFRSGFKGLWDRIRGEHRRIKEQNEREAYAALLRDRTEKDQLIFGHLYQRRRLNLLRERACDRNVRQQAEIRQDTEGFERMKSDSREDRLNEFKRKRQSRPSVDRTPGHGRGRSIDR